MYHAYIIIANEEPELLISLLKQLDYSNNDIYKHINKKVNAWIYRVFLQQ